MIIIQRADRRIKGSHCWNLVVHHLPFIVANSIWRLGQGNISFWKDQWLASPLPTLSVTPSPNITVRNVASYLCL